MHLTKFLPVVLLTLFYSCHGQEKTNTLHLPAANTTGPAIIRSVKAVGVPPDYDTTLVSQYIRSIFEDSKGHLWFGTLGDGIVRYDVNTLTYYSNPDGFIQQTVYAINEDKSGNLWIGTDQGVYKYDGFTFRNYSQKDGLTHIDITRQGILVDHAGTIWVGTHGGAFRYHPSADTTGGQCFSLFQSLPPVDVTGIMEDKNGHIWFATSDNGVYRYDGKTMVNLPSKDGLGDNYAGGIVQDASGNMWFTTNNGICKYDGKTFTEITSKDGLGGTEIWGLYIERSGIIWVTARGSTTLYDPALEKTDPKAFRVFTPVDGINCCVQSMHQDRSGRMWWGAGSGLFRFDGQRFYQVKQHGPWE